MALILNIETATEICSVSISKNGKIIDFFETNQQNSHSELLTIYIQKLLEQSNFKFQQLNAVAISSGPGSYTGLRIGTSTAKGLCYALDIPLISVSTLEAIAWGTIKNNHNDKGLYCPMLDARRMEVYCAVFDINLNYINEIEAKVIDNESFSELLQNHQIYFSGNGSEKCRDILSKYQNANFENIFASAKYIAEIAENKYNLNQFENLAYFEPLYLKNYIPGKSIVKGL